MHVTVIYLLSVELNEAGKLFLKHRVMQVSSDEFSDVQLTCLAIITLHLDQFPSRGMMELQLGRARDFLSKLPRCATGLSHL